MNLYLEALDRDVKGLSANLNIITKQARQDSRRIKNLKEVMTHYN
jgi:hypothetical protein